MSTTYIIYLRYKRQCIVKVENAIKRTISFSHRAFLYFVVKDVHLGDYFFFLTDRAAFAKRKPGIRFTESMVGTFSSTKNKNEETPCEFTVTVESDDVERMIQCDPAHAAKMTGTLTCSALSTAPMTITGGKVTKLLG